MPWRTSRHGFTLLESLVVIAIIGAVSAIVMPKLMSLRDARQAGAAADAFAREHELARITAVRFGRDAMLHIDTANVAFWVSADTNGLGHVATIGLKVSYKTSGVKLGSADTLLCFDMRGIRSSRGTCQSGATIVTFSRLTHNDSLQITALGKVLR
jgi:prepilin-type N-terminal cleavage/methylation domain-containing protein